MPTVTVNGANGQTFPIQFNSTDAFASAQSLAAAINAAVANPGVSTQVLTSAGTTTAPAAGKFGELVVTNNGATGFQVSAGGDQIIIANGTGPVTVSGTGTSNVSVLAGSGGLTFNAGSAANGANPTGVIVVAGDGNNVLGTATGAGGSAFFQTGSGNDSIQAVRGFNTVEAGLGANQIGTGSASDFIVTTGVDLVVGNITPFGGGSDTIAAVGTGSDFVFGGGSNLTFVSFSSTASTVIGGTGSDTIFSGSAGGQFYAGVGGNSSLIGGSGPVTLVGGGNGDQLFAVYNAGQGPTAAGSSYLVAGSANETISGIFDSRGVQAFAGNNVVSNGVTVTTANTVIYGSSGNDTIYAGTGNATLNSAGGVDVFGFINGSAGGNDTINGFTAADKIRLSGYTAASTVPGYAATGVAGVTVAGGNTNIQLSDNTRITITNFTSLNTSNFS